MDAGAIAGFENCARISKRPALIEGRMNPTSRILIVDDEPDTLGLIELTLQTAGFRVQTATHGEQALRLMRNDTYDLILLDVMMPGLTGFDVVRRLREEEIPTPPIIFLTAKSSEDDIEIGEGLEAAAYLIKPTTRGQLLDAIKQALEETPGS